MSMEPEHRNELCALRIHLRDRHTKLRCCSIVVLVAACIVGLSTNDARAVFGAQVPAGALIVLIGLTGWIAFWVLESHMVRELLGESPGTALTIDNRWRTGFYLAGALVLILTGGAIGSAGVPTTPFRHPPASPILVPCPPPVGESPVPASKLWQPQGLRPTVGGDDAFV